MLAPALPNIALDIGMNPQGVLTSCVRAPGSRASLTICFSGFSMCLSSFVLAYAVGSLHVSNLSQKLNFAHCYWILSDSLRHCPSSRVVKLYYNAPTYFILVRLGLAYLAEFADC